MFTSVLCQMQDQNHGDAKYFGVQPLNSTGKGEFRDRTSGALWIFRGKLHAWMKASRTSPPVRLRFVVRPTSKRC